MPMITINDKEYDTDQLSDQAKQQLGAIQYIDRKLAELNNEAMILQTARNTYANALNESLPKGEGTDQ